MGPDSDDLYYGDRGERAGRKPSLQSRLQGGMNLQICFMNDTGSDSESPSTDAESIESSSPQLEKKRPASLPIKVKARPLNRNIVWLAFSTDNSVLFPPDYATYDSSTNHRHK